jgi:transposase
VREREMAKPYSQDFRQKVITAIEIDGRKKGEVSEIFNISRNTINLWLKRKEETGAMEARSNKPLSSQKKITDWEKFREFAKENSSKTQSQMAEIWAGEISGRTISRALARIGFTRKKRLTDISNEMKPSVKYFWSN